MIPVYIGYDEREAGAFWTCAHSIMENASEPVQIIPLLSKQLPLTRPWDAKQSNDFAFTRFLVPYLQGFFGHAIFVDCDFLFFGDIVELWNLRDYQYSVQVCKHRLDTFKPGKKYLGTEQTVYERKCWSSLMLFNCGHPDTQGLVVDCVDKLTGLYLHQFSWTHQTCIGDLPLEWNWLVSHYPYKEDIKAAHFTEGGPYFHEYAEVDYAVDWWKANARMNHIAQLDNR